MGGSYWSSDLHNSDQDDDGLPPMAYRLDWRPDIRTPMDQRMMIKNTKYGNATDLFGSSNHDTTQIQSSIFWEKHDPARRSPAFKEIQLVRHHCGAAYAVAIACQLCLFLQDYEKKKERGTINKTENSRPEGAVVAEVAKGEKEQQDKQDSRLLYKEDLVTSGISTAYIYWFARKIEGDASSPLLSRGDTGCSFRSCLQAVEMYGFAKEIDFGLEYYGISKDPYWLVEKARKYKPRRVEKYRLTKDPKAVIQSLKNRCPVLIGYTLHETIRRDATVNRRGGNGPIYYTEPVVEQQQDKSSSDEIRGGYVGVIIKYEPEIRHFLVHGTPFPQVDRILISCETLRGPCVGDLWSVDISM